MFRAGSVNVARAVASNSKRAFSGSAAAKAPIRVGINGFGRIGRLVRTCVLGLLAEAVPIVYMPGSTCV